MANNLNEKNYINVYFIENHLKGIQLKIYFKDDEKQLYDSLKNEYRFDFNTQENEIYEVSVYSFKVYKQHLNEIKLKPKKYVKIILETQGKDKYETKINVSEFEERRNCFAFNTKFESCKKLFGIDLNTAPKALNLDDDQSFDIYRKYLYHYESK